MSRMKAPMQIGPCTDALARAVQYYRQFFNAQGPTTVSAADEAAFYNALYCLLITDSIAEHRGTLAWMRQHAIEPNGTFRVRPDGPMGGRSLYFKGWVAYGAHVSGAHDLSQACADALAAWQDRRTGGLPSIEPGQGREPTVTDVNSLALGIMTFLATGRTDSALRVAACLHQVVVQQPEPGKKFYCYLRLADGRLLIEEPENFKVAEDIYRPTAKAADEIDRHTFCVSHAQPVNPYAILSMAVVALALLFDATRDQSVWTSLQGIVRFLRTAGRKFWEHGQTSKTVWGLALVYRLEPSEELGEMIEATIESFCRSQKPDGGWQLPLFQGKYEEMPDWMRMAYVGDMILALHGYLHVYVPAAMAAVRAGA